MSHARNHLQDARALPGVLVEGDGMSDVGVAGPCWPPGWLAEVVPCASAQLVGLPFHKALTFS